MQSSTITIISSTQSFNQTFDNAANKVQTIFLSINIYKIYIYIKDSEPFSTTTLIIIIVCGVCLICVCFAAIVYFVSKSKKNKQTNGKSLFFKIKKKNNYCYFSCDNGSFIG